MGTLQISWPGLPPCRFKHSPVSPHPLLPTTLSLAFARQTTASTSHQLIHLRAHLILISTSHSLPSILHIATWVTLQSLQGRGRLLQHSHGFLRALCHLNSKQSSPRQLLPYIPHTAHLTSDPDIHLIWQQKNRLSVSRCLVYLPPEVPGLLSCGRRLHTRCRRIYDPISSLGTSSLMTA